MHRLSIMIILQDRILFHFFFNYYYYMCTYLIPERASCVSLNNYRSTEREDSNRGMSGTAHNKVEAVVVVEAVNIPSFPVEGVPSCIVGRAAAGFLAAFEPAVAMIWCAAVRSLRGFAHQVVALPPSQRGVP